MIRLNSFAFFLSLFTVVISSDGLFFPSISSAQTPSILLNPKLTNSARNLTIEVVSEPSVSDCTATVFASANKKSIGKNIDSATLLAIKADFDNENIFLAGRIPSLREKRNSARENVFFRTKVECSGGVYLSGVERLQLKRKGKSGPSDVSDWISKVKKQLTKGEVRLVEPFPALTFQNPVDFQTPPGKSGKVFIVEQSGKIISFDNQAGVSSGQVFLDIKDRVKFDGEQGLLGLAFHPKFQDNGYLYVNYIDLNGDTVIARFTSAAKAAGIADPGSEQKILQVSQPFDNHNGGQIAFGPDGLLYIALGDGGSGGDPEGNGQNKATLLGKILRINIDQTADGNNYSIPGSNPFADINDGTKKEIFAYGFRNPWRFSFDSENGQIWTGDVGQGAREEVNLVVRGGNYGWNVKEGFICFNPSENCNSEGLIDPIIDYPRSQGGSITGGYVYRGKALASITGFYVYGDFLSGRVWAVQKARENVLNTELFDTDYAISSFGTDDDGELYLLNYSSGKIYKFSS